MQAGYGVEANIMWVTGKMGTGKTTFIDEQVKKGATAVFVGRVCREKFGEANMAKDKNASAPEYTEQFVRELVMDEIAKISSGGTIIIDGMPRKPSQVQWIYNTFMQNPMFKSTVYYFRCEEEQRLQRAINRDKDKKDAMSLLAARAETESHNFLRVLEECIIFKMDMVIADTTTIEGVNKEGSSLLYSPIANMPHLEDRYEKEELEMIPFVDTNLEHMFAAHRAFSNMVMTKIGITMDELFTEAQGKDTLHQMNRSVEWARKFVQKAIVELGELQRDIPDEWWTVDTVSLRAARVELIDAMHFLISASVSLGMDAKDFVRCFYDKLQVNIHRQQTGYSKKNKQTSDDTHVGSHHKFSPEKIIPLKSEG